MNIFEATFEKHKKLMMESLVAEQDLTKEQNQTIKIVYIFFRDLLEEITNNAKGMDVTAENASAKFNLFFKEYNPVKKQMLRDGKSYVKIEKDPSFLKLYVYFPDNIRKILPRLGQKIEIRLQLNEGGSDAEFNSNNGILNELVVRVPKMLKDFNSYKVSLQHEMQHIIDAGGKEDDSIENGFVRGMVYTLIPGEIKAHAKQYAYMYYKKFPNDSQLDYEKFKKEFFEKGNIKLDNYIKYGDRPEKIKKAYNLSDDLYQKMVNGFKDFKVALIRSFLYFKEK